VPDLNRFDKDPEAIAWARGKIQATVSRYVAFATRASAEGRLGDAAAWRRTADEVRRDLLGQGHVIGSFDERLPAMKHAADPAPAASAAGTGPEWRPVIYDLMAGQYDYFVLTDALSEWAGRQRHEAEDDPDGNAHRTAWAETAERLLARAEAAVSRPGGECSGFVVADQGTENGWPDLGYAPVVHDLAAAIEERDEKRGQQTAHGKPDRYYVAGLIEVEASRGDHR